MIYLNEEKTEVLIFSGRISNELLSKGYRIIRLLPDKRNKIKTVFVFQATKGFEDDVLKLTKNEDVW